MGACSVALKIFLLVSCMHQMLNWYQKKSLIQETKNLSTDADSMTDIIFERLHDSSFKKINKQINKIQNFLIGCAT